MPASCAAMGYAAEVSRRLQTGVTRGERGKKKNSRRFFPGFRNPPTYPTGYRRVNFAEFLQGNRWEKSERGGENPKSLTPNSRLGPSFAAFVPPPSCFVLEAGAIPVHFPLRAHKRRHRLPDRLRCCDIYRIYIPLAQQAWPPPEIDTAQQRRRTQPATPRQMARTTQTLGQHAA